MALEQGWSLLRKDIMASVNKLSERDATRIRVIIEAAQRQQTWLYAYRDPNTDQEGTLAGIYSTRNPSLVPTPDYWAISPGGTLLSVEGQYAR